MLIADKPYTVINPQSTRDLILTCEHASALIPEQYQNLGLKEKDLETHIARDKGCKELTIALAEKLGCCAFLGNYSRLLIDLNRRENEEELIVSVSDKKIIPSNENISEEEKQYRLKTYYRPYYQAVLDKISSLKRQGIQPRLFSVHGFTPQLKGGTFRPWNAGILYLEPTPLSQKLLKGLGIYPGLKVDSNVPYDLRKYNTGASVICGAEQGLDNALIEIRDTEFNDIQSGTEKWCAALSGILAA